MSASGKILFFGYKMSLKVIRVWTVFHKEEERTVELCRHQTRIYVL